MASPVIYFGEQLFAPTQLDQLAGTSLRGAPNFFLHFLNFCIDTHAEMIIIQLLREQEETGKMEKKTKDTKKKPKGQTNLERMEAAGRITYSSAGATRK
jgi:hypothetical protein